MYEERLENKMEYINQHLVPKCYMRKWCYTKDKVLTCTKDNMSIQSKNIINLNAKNRFYDFTLKSLWRPKEFDAKIFKSLSKYDIYCSGKKLANIKEIAKYYCEKSEWIIKDEYGQIITKGKSDELFNYLDEERDCTIERLLSKKIESKWPKFIEKIENKVRDQSGNCIYVKKNEIHSIIENLFIFSCRSFNPNNIISNIIKDALRDLDFDDCEIEKNERSYADCPTIHKEFEHSFFLEQLYMYLKFETGVIKKLIDRYEENLNVSFLLSDESNNSCKFITGNNPSFQYTFPNKKLTNIFVATPTMLILMCKKDSNKSLIKRLDSYEIEKYNKKIAENNDIIILPYKNFNFNDLL